MAEWVIASDRREFYLSEIQADMSARYGAPPSGVRHELLTMRDHGLLEASARDRRMYFEPRDTQLWEAFRVAIDAIKAER